MAAAPPIGDDAMDAAWDRVAAPGAIVVVDVDRDERAGFRVEARALAPGTRVPSRDELVPLVPAGSRWTDAVGWTATFGGPLVTSFATIWAIGLATVEPRAGGGAAPRARVYLHAADPEPIAARLEALASVLDPSANARLEPFVTKVVVRGLPGTRPESSRAEQAWVLRAAAAAVRAGGRPAFRTVALSEAELVPLLAWRPRLPAGADRALVGVAEAFERRYSPGTLVRLAWRSFWRPY